MGSLSKPKIPVGGLALGPNDLDAPPGNFLVAENVVHRRDGILEPLPGEQYFMEVTGGQYSRVFSDWEPKYYLRIRKQTADDFGQLVDTSDAVYSAKFLPGETQCVYTDSRHILSGAEYNVVVENITEDTAAAPRRAGLPQVAGISFSVLTPTAGTAVNPTIPANKAAAYTVVVRRKITGGRFIQSAPCSPVAVRPIAADYNYTLRVFFHSVFDDVGTDATYAEGDQLLIYRTALTDSVAEINGTYYLAVVYDLSATDITNSFAVVQDNTLDENLGEELYTNPGQQGALKANIIPPEASGVETYSGTTFYINKRAQPNVTASVVGALGGLPLGVDDATRQKRKNGIGRRSFTGTFTAGDPNITDISADDFLGMGTGQIVTNINLATPMRIVAFGGSGPYTVSLSGLATTSQVGSTATVVDTFIIEATKNGVTTTSDVMPMGDLIDLQSSLLSLRTAANHPIPGFVVNASEPASILSGSIDGGQIQLNFAVLSPEQWDSFVIRFSNPRNWAQGVKGVFLGSRNSLDSVQETRRNVVWYSKTNLPEDVSPIQFIAVGNGTVYRLLNVQSTMLAFCSDGLFKVDGQGDVWNITAVDTAARLVHPDCASASGQLGYAWLERGLCVVSETGVEDFSKDAIGPPLKGYARAFYALTNGPRWLWGPSLVIDRHNRDVWLNIVHLETGEAPQKYATYIFNTETGKFTTAGNTYTALSYFPPVLNLIRAKNGFSGNGLYRPYFPPEELAADYLPATVVYQPFVENAGEVKQWVDVNYFFDDVPQAVAPALYSVEALFGGELTSSTNLFELNASQAPSVLFALHSGVPRRCARDVELVFGFRTSIVPDDDHPSGGYYFQFKGASVRARVASQIVKR